MTSMSLYIQYVRKREREKKIYTHNGEREKKENEEKKTEHREIMA